MAEHVGLRFHALPQRGIDGGLVAGIFSYPKK
jgi:hypothetical protein